MSYSAAGLMSQLQICEAIKLRSIKLRNIKFVISGFESAASPHMSAAVEPPNS